jgi:hypothetical protein
MGSRWESVIFRADDAPDFAAVAASAASLLERCEPAPKVMIHFMTSSPDFGDTAFVSCELTVFREKPLLLTSSAAKELSATVFAGTQSGFTHADIALAQQLSVLLGRNVVYTSVDDTYNSTAFVSFAGGEIQDYAVIGWEGTATTVAKAGGAPDETAVYDGIRRALPELDIRAVEDLFDCFYSDESDVVSYVLVAQGQRLDVPRRVD